MDGDGGAGADTPSAMPLPERGGAGKWVAKQHLSFHPGLVAFEMWGSSACPAQRSRRRGAGAMLAKGVGKCDALGAAQRRNCTQTPAAA